jgi:hypothetical protein
MKKLIILIPLLAVILLTGCGKKKTENTSSGDNQSTANTTENKNEDESGPLAISQKEFMKSVNDCKPSDSCTYFKATYLEVTSGKGKDKLNALINREILSSAVIGESRPVSIQAAADSFMVSYAETKKQFPNMPGSWFWEYNMKIYSEMTNLLCLEADNFTFMGGAHPNFVTSYYIISKETGDTVGLKELLIPGFETKLNTLIDKKYREMKSLKPGDNLQEKGDLFENKITFTYNAAVTKEGGLEFYYNPYEIAAYVYGPIAIPLTKAELGDLINPNGPLK